MDGTAIAALGVIVALGGGSVMDVAKLVAATRRDGRDVAEAGGLRAAP